MPPLYRIDVAKKVYYALDDNDRDSVLAEIEANNNRRDRINVQRFKGLGEMNPVQLRDTTMKPATRSLVRLEVSQGDETYALMDMLQAKKRAQDRKSWLERKGDQAEFA